MTDRHWFGLKIREIIISDLVNISLLLMGHASYLRKFDSLDCAKMINSSDVGLELQAPK